MANVPVFTSNAGTWTTTATTSTNTNVPWKTGTDFYGNAYKPPSQYQPPQARTAQLVTLKGDVVATMAVPPDSPSYAWQAGIIPAEACVARERSHFTEPWTLTFYYPPWSGPAPLGPLPIEHLEAKYRYKLSLATAPPFPPDVIHLDNVKVSDLKWAPPKAFYTDDIPETKAQAFSPFKPPLETN